MLKSIFISLVVLTSIALAAKIKTEENSDKKFSTRVMPDTTMESEDQDNMESGEEDSGDQDTTYNLEDIMNNCNESFRIEMAYLNALNASGSFPDETEKTPKCYIRCVLERLNVASNEGTFDASRAAVVLVAMRNRNSSDVRRFENISGDCTDRKESCKCERSYQFLKCIIENDINSSKLNWRT